MGIIKKAAKSVGKLIGYDSDAITAAGKEQAAATTKAASEQAAAMRDQAAQAQRQQETLQAQRQAADSAAALLDQPVETADVDISTAADDGGEVDAATGKRLRPRDKYSASSINI